jgi:lipopolysaccharide heptosyltransferase I
VNDSGPSRRILIVRLSSFGDVIHALPLAANAKRAGADVAWLVEPAYRGLLEADPAVDRVFVADTKRWRRNPLSAAADVARLRRELREFAPDRTLDVQGLWKSALLARSAGAPVVGFAAADRKEATSALLCDEPVRPLPGGHVVDRNLALAEAAGVPIRERSPDATFLLSRPSAEADGFLAGQPAPFALYHPGAGRPDKTWGEERFAALAKLLSADAGLEPVVSWGPGDEERARRMAELLPNARVLPLLPPEGLARVASRASLFVGGDTGPLHLADALGVPTLALFGPTDPARNGPYRRPSSAVRYDAATETGEVARRAFEVLAA